MAFSGNNSLINALSIFLILALGAIAGLSFHFGYALTNSDFATLDQIK